MEDLIIDLWSVCSSFIDFNSFLGQNSVSVHPRISSRGAYQNLGEDGGMYSRGRLIGGGGGGWGEEGRLFNFLELWPDMIIY